MGVPLGDQFPTAPCRTRMPSNSTEIAVQYCSNYMRCALAEPSISLVLFPVRTERSLASVARARPQVDACAAAMRINYQGRRRHLLIHSAQQYGYSLLGHTPKKATVARDLCSRSRRSTDAMMTTPCLVQLTKQPTIGSLEITWPGLARLPRR